jgi:hypothetical protein
MEQNMNQVELQVVRSCLRSISSCPFGEQTLWQILTFESCISVELQCMEVVSTESCLSINQQY